MLDVLETGTAVAVDQGHLGIPLCCLLESWRCSHPLISGGSRRIGTLGGLGGSGPSRDDDDSDDDDKKKAETWFAGGERRSALFSSVTANILT